MERFPSLLSIAAKSVFEIAAGACTMCKDRSLCEKNRTAQKLVFVVLRQVPYGGKKERGLDQVQPIKSRGSNP